MRRRRISWSDFEQVARDRFQLDLQNGEGAGDRPLTVADILLMDIKPAQFLMANMFHAGELILIVGAAKTSKSYFTLDILAALAGNGKIGDRIRAEIPCNVAIVDGELSLNELAARISRIGSLHGNMESWSNSFVVVSAKHERRAFDLSNEADQLWLETRIGCAKVVAFDNYGKLAGSRGDTFQTWRQIADWFGRLQQRGTTVILVHHENKNEQVRGTNKMIDDADLLVSLKRPQEGWVPSDGNIVEVHFPAARHLHGDQVEPFAITYAEDETGFHRSVGEVGDIETSSSRDMVPAVSETEIATHGLSLLHVEMLGIARRLGRVEAKNVVESGVQGRSRSSVTNAFGELCAKKLLVAAGTSKKGRYYVPAGQGIGTGADATDEEMD